ncbi:MAG: bifunctional UDP-sugar hydrolase/5'-nucleotidase [Tissierellia bacterium]|nr:bifunctional UDP-sugar hydrolase/5'-nucleotidase [Tissierellia bacterium]
MDLRNLTLLHSNDLHGDFFVEEEGHVLVGGVSMLSGYVNKTKSEIENSIYVIAGDMLQGSIIDNEFKGISTIDIINMLKPDVVTLGNHEIDYGLGHLMFLEKCAKFPIINANLYIKITGTRLFKSHLIYQIGGMNILFIGIITNEVIAQATDTLISSFVDIEEAALSVESICNSYKTIDIDFTIILTHIGIDDDIKLAKLLNPDLGVDLIIGGHSHTYMEKPLKVNDILIAQAGVGTNHIGRFDLIINADTNSVHDYKWELIPIDSSHCERDKELDELLDNYNEKVEGKYNRVLRRLDKVYTHPDRYMETDLGNLITDIYWQCLGVDIFIYGSGSIRGESLGEIVTLKDLREVVPYEDKLYCIWLKGSELINIIENYFRNYNTGKTREFYQFSRHVHIIFDKRTNKIEEFIYYRKPLRKEKVYSLGLQGFHFNMMEEIFEISKKDISKYKMPKVVSTCSREMLDEFFATELPIKSKIEDRIILK